MGCMCFIVMLSFKRLTNKYCGKQSKNIRLDKCNQYFNKIYKYGKRNRES